jgi:hypothetical protein
VYHVHGYGGRHLPLLLPSPLLSALDDNSHLQLLLDFCSIMFMLLYSSTFCRRCPKAVLPLLDLSLVSLMSDGRILWCTLYQLVQAHARHRHEGAPLGTTRQPLRSGHHLMLGWAARLALSGHPSRGPKKVERVSSGA